MNPEMKTLKPIEMKENQKIQIILIDGTKINILTMGDDCSIVEVNHYRTDTFEEDKLEKLVGFETSKRGNHSWSECKSEFGSFTDKSKVMVHHIAHNK